MESNKLESNILRVIASDLCIKALDGSRLICDANNVFKAFVEKDFINWGMNKYGASTAESKASVFELISNASFCDLFMAMPGPWRQKYFSQNQVIYFCENFSEWLKQGHTTIFLCKINEAMDIDESNPGSNLVFVDVGSYYDGLHVYVNLFSEKHVWSGSCRRHIVAPCLV